MITFLGEHVLEVIFGLISAGTLAFCKYLYTQLKSYKKLLEEQEGHKTEILIDTKLEPIFEELEELRKSILQVSDKEQQHIDLILSSYRFRLVQLCKVFIKQGYMTQEQYDQLTEFFKIYHGLGGNGQAQEYYETAMKLPIRATEY